MNRIFKKMAVLALIFLSQLTLKTDCLNANTFKNIKFLGNPLSTPKYKFPFELKACDKNSEEIREQKLCAYTENLSKKLEMESPEAFIFYAKDEVKEYNAFATYQDKHPIIAFGNLFTQRWQEEWVTDQEIEAIIAHELCHIKYNHLIKAGILNLILTGPSLIGKIIVPMPSPKEIIKNTYSRKQEREADKKAIEIIDDPLNLLSALVKLECLITKTSLTKEDFGFNYEITLEKLAKEKESCIAPLIEILSDHPLTSTRMAYITKRTKN